MLLGSDENLLVWKRNICDALKDLADIEMQGRTWSGADPSEISSFTETLAMLYDSFDFERYIQFYRSVERDYEVYEKLSELNNLINAYKDIGYEIEKMDRGHETILEDIRWRKITEKANEVLTLAVWDGAHEQGKP
jgi:hypothetical protein